jgi:hypothetical protein
MRTENLTSTFNGLFQSFEEKMRNKPMNYFIIMMGLILFLSFCFLKDDPRISNSMNSTIIIGIAAIVGAMLTLFGLINLAAICCIHEREKKIFKGEQKN